MKKLALLALCVAVMASCDNFSGGKKSQLQVENDSLKMARISFQAQASLRREKS